MKNLLIKLKNWGVRAANSQWFIAFLFVVWIAAIWLAGTTASDILAPVGIVSLFWFLIVKFKMVRQTKVE